MTVSTVVLSIALVVVVKTSFLAPAIQNKLKLPKLETGFLGEFAPIADHSYEYASDAAMVNFQDPMLHPENVVLIDHIVVNLHPTSGHSNPMALADFYVELGSRDAAIELKEREVEVRDSLSRTLEQISYDDITTDVGKYKLKVIIRKNLNSLLTTGRVRKLYFKTLVLKP